ncbi:hypothetical protein QOT17_025131 [Balamuthia mandrillaris]
MPRTQDNSDAALPEETEGITLYHLPEETLCYLMSFLDGAGLCRLGCTCKLFHRLAYTRSIWLKTSKPFRRYQFITRRLSLRKLQTADSSITYDVATMFSEGRYCFLSLSKKQTKLVEKVRALYYTMFAQTDDSKKQKHRYSHSEQVGFMRSRCVEGVCCRPGLEHNNNNLSFFPWPWATPREKKLLERYHALMVDISRTLLLHICKELGLPFGAMEPLIAALKRPAEGQDPKYTPTNHELLKLMAFVTDEQRVFSPYYWLEETKFIEGGLFQILTTWNQAEQNCDVMAGFRATGHALTSSKETTTYHIPLSEISARNQVVVVGGWMLGLLLKHMGRETPSPPYISLWANLKKPESEEDEARTGRSSAFLSFSAQVSYPLLKLCMEQAVEGGKAQKLCSSSVASTVRIIKLRQQKVHIPDLFCRVVWHSVSKDVSQTYAANSKNNIDFFS